jgi:hypothetical protein
MYGDRNNQGQSGTTGCILRKVLLPFVVLAFVAAACGEADDKGIATGADVASSAVDAGDDDTTTTEAADAASSTTVTSVDDAEESTTTETTETSTETTTEDEDLPGEAIDLFVEIGDVLGVVGVSDDDTLNVRAKPGTDQEILTTVDGETDDLVGTGRARSLPSSIWYEVSVDGDIGWVSSSFVAFLGGTDDATAEFMADGGSVSAETMTDLGQLVAERFASEDPPSKIVQTVAPTVGDLGEVVYDVVGIGDDALLGYRLHIFATEDDNGETFTVSNIERTSLCTRGLDGERCT